jgi:hypothetical protein
LLSVGFVNDPDGQYMMGLQHETGVYGKRQSYREALTGIWKHVEAKHVGAMLKVGLFRLQNIGGISQDYP